MDEGKAFFEGLTFFNWLTLTAFAIALVSGLNALLTLRSRWKDWRTIKTKAKFEKRLADFKEQIRLIAIFRDSKQDFVVYGFDILFRYLVRLSVAIIFSLVGLFFMFSTVPQSVKPLIAVIAFGVASNVVIGALSNLQVSGNSLLT